MSSYKLNSFSSKTSSCRFTTSRAGSAKSAKSKVVNPKTVLPSKKLFQIVSEDRKAYSAGVISESKKSAKPKKTTKSDFNVRKQSVANIDFCKKCGDAVSLTKNTGESRFSLSSSSTSKNGCKSNKSTTGRKLTTSVKQYYKNENYRPSEESIQDITLAAKKIALDTIKEVSEIHPSESVFKICPDSEDELTIIDTDDQECLEQIKEFRQKNYFECHSAKFRIRNKGSATRLQDHKCVYRFYLNDRLFPVPLSTDHKNQVRCVECHLPMKLNAHECNKINGTIQAKVTLGKKMQDLMLLLPVKEPLIITEKRREEKMEEKEVVFFGVINLDGVGNSMFNSTLPNNSFALKYQKGYKEFELKEEYSYRDFDKNDVIVI